MFDKLIDLVMSLGQKLLPFTVTFEYDSAVIMRLGSFHKVLDTGLTFKIPLADTVLKIDSRVNYSTTHPRTLLTKDGKSVTVSGIASYRAGDKRLAVLSQNNYAQSVWDGMYQSISKLVQNNNYDLVVSAEFAQLMTDAVRKYNQQFGIDIISCRLQDTSSARAYRLFKE